MKRYRSEPRWLTELISKLDGTAMPRIWHKRPAKFMMKKKTAAAITALLALLGALSTPAQNLLTNGDFETGFSLSAGTYTNLSSGLTGWTIHTPGNIDIVRGPYTGFPDGNETHFVDLAGSWGGIIEQEFTVTSGSTYDVSLKYAANPAATGQCRELRVYIFKPGQLIEQAHLIAAGQTVSGAHTNRVITTIENEWRTNTFQFTATGTTSAKIHIRTCGGEEASGALVDDVSVTLAP